MSISKDELKAMVAKLCAIDSDAIKNETLLVGELKMDSIKIIELLATLHEEYDIHATEEDAANFNTFNDLYEFTQKKINS